MTAVHNLGKFFIVPESQKNSWCSLYSRIAAETDIEPFVSHKVSGFSTILPPSASLSYQSIEIKRDDGDEEIIPSPTLRSLDHKSSVTDKRTLSVIYFEHHDT